MNGQNYEHGKFNYSELLNTLALGLKFTQFNKMHFNTKFAYKQKSKAAKLNTIQNNNSRRSDELSAFCYDRLNE